MPKFKLSVSLCVRVIISTMFGVGLQQAYGFPIIFAFRVTCLFFWYSNPSSYNNRLLVHSVLGSWDDLCAKSPRCASVDRVMTTLLHSATRIVRKLNRFVTKVESQEDGKSKYLTSGYVEDDEIF
jgi:hypothetical protein